MNLTQITSKLTPRGWLMVGGSVAATLAFLYLLVTMASAPSYTTLLAGVNPAQTSKITSALSTAGVSYELQNGGTAIAVESGQVSQARVALAGAGLLGSSTQPLSLISNQSLGESTQEANEVYQAALEQQLDDTIENIQGVTTASVQIVLPDPTNDLFSSTAAAASASVNLIDSPSFNPGAAQGIADTVAGAVPGLTAANVKIVDQTGSVIWPSGSGANTGGLLSKQAAENAYDSSMEAKVGALLAGTIGVGKSQVVVSSDLNTDQTNSQSLVYSGKPIPLTTNSTKETLVSKGGGSSPTTAGVTGTVSSGGSGPSNYKNNTEQTTYGVDKTVTQSNVSAGQINSQSVSVLINKTVPAAEIPLLKSAISAAVGLNTKRGDTISVSQVAFAPAPALPTPAATTTMIGYAKYALVGIGAVVFLFFMSRMLRKREREGFAGQPTWLRELEAPRPLAAVEAEQLTETTRIMQLRSPVNVAKQQVEDLVERDPDRVASQVRAWMAED